MRKYKPEIGRWLSRDPIGEDGGVSLFEFALNRPTVSHDHLGLVSMPWGWLCCGNGYYDPKTQCCVTLDNGENEVIRKEPIPSGVQTHLIRVASPNTSRTIIHMWITWPDGSAEANAAAILNTTGHGDMMIRIPASGGSLPYQSVSTTSVMLSPCEYNFSDFYSCLSSTAQTWKDLNMQFFCDAFVSALVSTCSASLKGKGFTLL